MRAHLGRIPTTVVMWAGILAAFAWAFVGSLVLGLGAGQEDRVIALSWLGAEVLIGAVTLCAVLLGTTAREDRPGGTEAGRAPADGTRHRSPP